MAQDVEIVEEAGVECESSRCASGGQCIWLARRRGRVHGCGMQITD